MAAVTTQPSDNRIEEAFIADRALFWNRWVGATKFAVGVMVVVLLFLLIVVY